MKTPRRRTPLYEGKTRWVLLAALSVFACGAFSFADEPGKARRRAAAQASGQSPGGQNMQRIAAEIQKVGAELGPLFASPQDLFEPAKRAAAAPKAIPALRKMVTLLDELIAARPAGASQGQERTQLMALLAALGDYEAATQLTTMATSPVAAEAAAGQSAQLFAAWLLTDGKPAGQQKVVDDLAAAAKRYPAEPTLAGAALMLAGTTRPEAQELRQKIATIVSGALTSPAAATVSKQLDTINAKFATQQKLRAMEGKPLTLQGPTPQGGVVSTADYKGKVVLVDFWATWCGPCKDELPKLKKVYAQYHSQGLEVVGVSCDNDGEALVQFLGQNRDMPWPQLFDAGQPGWHALASEYGINAIPTMFLIDRKGILRSVDARTNYEKLVPELLKE